MDDLGDDRQHDRRRRPHPLPRPRRGAPRVQHEDATATSRRSCAGSSTATTGYPPIPIVWGISATIERFKEAMEEADATRPPARPAAGRSSTRRACRSPGSSRTPSSSTSRTRRATSTRCSCAAPRASCRDSTERWAAVRDAAGAARGRRSRCSCCRSPNTPDPDDVGVALDTIFAEYPELDADVGAPRPRRAHDADVRRVGGRLDRAAAGAGRRPTCACSSRRTRSRPAGTARAPRCSCRSGRRRTRRTSRSCSAGWSATRSPAASPATSD